MIIPIVRRTVTVRVRETFRFPFQCAACMLTTAASVLSEGVGSATMAYLAPDENVARNAARANAYASACSCFAQCPCPRCGAHSVGQRNAVRLWEQRVVTRKQLRFWLTVVGLAMTLITAGGCGTWFLVDQGLNGSNASGAAIMAIVWVGLGSAATGIAYAIAGPGARPVLQPFIPQNVMFDPPDAAQVGGSYRTG